MDNHLCRMVQGPKFSAMRCKAEAARIIALEAKIDRNAVGWQRHAWRLERTFPQQFGHQNPAVQLTLNVLDFGRRGESDFRPNTINIHEKQTNCSADHNKTRRRKNNENDSSNEFFDNPGALINQA